MWLAGANPIRADPGRINYWTGVLEPLQMALAAGEPKRAEPLLRTLLTELSFAISRSDRRGAIRRRVVITATTCDQCDERYTKRQDRTIHHFPCQLVIESFNSAIGKAEQRVDRGLARINNRRTVAYVQEDPAGDLSVQRIWHVDLSTESRSISSVASPLKPRSQFSTVRD